MPPRIEPPHPAFHIDANFIANDYSIPGIAVQAQQAYPLFARRRFDILKW